MQPGLDLTQPPESYFKRWVLPGSQLYVAEDVWRLINDPTPASTYTDAQLDDYQGLRRPAFPWKPPVTLEVEARFLAQAGEVIGTAGFGFWNDPFAMTGRRSPALPQALWFFYASPHSNLRLAKDIPGHGWKAASLDARRLSFMALAPTAPLAVPLMNIPAVYDALWPIGQWAIGVQEALLPASMPEWHTYRLEWRAQTATFWVDEAVVLRVKRPPRGPLGFVLWIDNQAMTVSPQGRFGWQALGLRSPQRMEVRRLYLAPG